MLHLRNIFKVYKVTIFFIAWTVVAEASNARLNSLLDSLPGLIESNSYIKYFIELNKLIKDKNVKKDPRYAELLYYLSDIYFRNELYIKSEKLLLRAIKLPDTRSEIKEKLFMKLASIYVVTDRLRDAYLIYKKVKNPLNGDWLSKYHIARLLIYKGFFDDALTLLENIKGHSYDGKIMYAIGVAYAGKGEFQKSIMSFNRCREMTSSKYLSDLARIQIARIDAEDERYNEAMTAYGEISDDELKNLARIEKVWIFFESGDLEKARKIIEEVKKNTSYPDVLLESKILTAYLKIKKGEVDDSWRYLKEMLREYERMIQAIDIIIKEFSSNHEGRKIQDVLNDKLTGNLRIYSNLFEKTHSMKLFYSIKKDSRNLFNQLDNLFSSIVLLEDRIITQANKSVNQDINFANTLRERLMELKLAPIIEKVSYTERNIYEKMRNYRREILGTERSLRHLMDAIYGKVKQYEKKTAQLKVPEKIIMKYNTYAGIGRKAAELNNEIRELLDYSLEKLDLLLSIYSIKYNIKKDPRIKRIDKMIGQIDSLKRELFSLWEGFNTSVVIEMEKIKGVVKDYRGNAKSISSYLANNKHIFEIQALKELKNQIVDQLGKTELVFTEVSWLKKIRLSRKIEKIYSSIDRLQSKEEEKINSARGRIEKTMQTNLSDEREKFKTLKNPDEIIRNLDRVKKISDQITKQLKKTM